MPLVHSLVSKAMEQVAYTKGNESKWKRNWEDPVKAQEGGISKGNEEAAQKRGAEQRKCTSHRNGEQTVVSCAVHTPKPFT